MSEQGHTLGELRAGTMQMDADDWAKLNDSDALHIVQRGQDVIAAVWCGDDRDDEEAANAERLALCWNSHDALVEALKNLVELGKRDLVGNRNLTPSKYDAVFDQARAALAAAGEKS